ncbi:MAG: hypothetical protein H0T62_08350 [Parachlamydiaceae bacterium]|nr:hypothetical protein [Parachlamydiaceae bacterium]
MKLCTSRSFCRAPIEQIDPAHFTSTFFILPIRFQIDNIKLFDIDGNPWCDAPIMSLATEVVDVVKNLKTTRKEMYIFIEGPGDIEFTMVDNENVRIDCDAYNHTTITVKYNVLLEALLKYENKVRIFLSDGLPEMCNHPYTYLYTYDL